MEYIVDKAQREVDLGPSTRSYLQTLSAQASFVPPVVFLSQESFERSTLKLTCCTLSDGKPSIIIITVPLQLRWHSRMRVCSSHSTVISTLRHTSSTQQPVSPCRFFNPREIRTRSVASKPRHINILRILKYIPGTLICCIIEQSRSCSNASNNSCHIIDRREGQTHFTKERQTKEKKKSRKSSI